jgi:cytochrome c-type biogenesis protein CcmH/NrfG
MDDINNDAPKTGGSWKPVQAYSMAVICLLIGVPVGYLLHGPAKPAPAAMVQPMADNSAAAMGAAAAPQQPQAPQKMPSLDEMKSMADKQAAPLLAQLKSNPKDPKLLAQVGEVYQMTHQFKKAIEYYNRSLAIDPKNVPVRTVMASCMYYEGDVDGALAQLQKSLVYDPKHGGTLMNIGIIKWKSKHDAAGAVAAWEQLLKVDPDFEQKDIVQHLIAEVKQKKPAGPAAGRS